MLLACTFLQGACTITRHMYAPQTWVATVTIKQEGECWRKFAANLRTSVFFASLVDHALHLFRVRRIIIVAENVV